MLGHDLKFGLRTLVRSPGFAFIAILTLGLGIGANAAIFSVIDSVLLQPLPFREPDRIVGIYEAREAKGWATQSFTHANFWDVRDRQRSLESIGAFAWSTFNLTGLDEPLRVRAGRASTGFLEVLGVRPIAGRIFRKGDDEPGADLRQVVLAERFWRTRLAADSAVVGRALTLNGESYAVVGIVPRGEPFLDWFDLFVPMVRDPNADRGSFELQVIGRLAPGTTFEMATADLNRVARDLAREYQEDQGMGVTLERSDEWIASTQTRRALWVLMGAVGFLLLIACVNLANLFLAKATGRTRERSLRAALGASRSRIVKQVLTEAFLVSGLGALAGLGLAFGILHVLRGVESGIPRLADVTIDWGVLGFTTVVTILTALLTGTLPAIQVNRDGIAAALRDGDRQAGVGRGMGRLRSGLIAVEVAASLALLVGAALLLRSFSAIMSVNRGFETAGRVLVEVAVPAAYDGDRATRIIEELTGRLQSTPEIVSVAAASNRPLGGVGMGMGFAAADKPDPAEKDIPWASWRVITAGYFRTLGVPVLRGRDFTPQDIFAKPWRVIVSRRIAERIWPGEDPIGRTITLWKGQGGTPAEVIGVSGDMRDWGLTSDPSMTVYLPYYGSGWSTVYFVVHGNLTAGALSGRFRSVLSEVDPTLPISRVESLDERVSNSVASRRLLMILLATFAAVALVMALAGVYGVLSFAVSRRTSEIGVRLAMGATSGEILGLIVRQGMRPVIVGLVVGAVVALGLSRLMTGILFEIKATDPATYLIVAGSLAVAALLSCYLPARQALRIDVVAALRKE